MHLLPRHFLIFPFAEHYSSALNFNPVYAQKFKFFSFMGYQDALFLENYPCFSKEKLKTKSPFSFFLRTWHFKTIYSANCIFQKDTLLNKLLDLGQFSSYSNRWSGLHNFKNKFVDQSPVTLASSQSASASANSQVMLLPVTSKAA